MNKLEREYFEGQWATLDRILNYLNTVDTSLYPNTKELKKHLYSEILEMLPEKKRPNPYTKD